MKKKEVIVILDNIRSTFNVGSIFRTADALGVSGLVLTGTTPCPTDRFGREQKDIAKVALGAEKSVSWKYEKNILSAVKGIRKEGYQIIAVEQAKNSIDYKKIKTKDKVAFIMGEEVKGINKEILKLADAVAEIPMCGSKESLNVSVAFGVALFRILNI
jgi:23S rRNA (guanosine2251-2'-O)-methyltransferase